MRTTRSGAALIVLTTVELIVFVDTTVVNVALPSIGRDLAMSEAGLAWVVGAYQLTFGGLQLIGGRAADLLGRRSMFTFGLAVFTAASLLAGVAHTAWLLVAARALQGIGAALVVPAEISLLAVTFPEPRGYARAFAVWSAMGAAGAALGAALGGVVTQGLGWQWIFLINLPVGVLALVGSRRLLPRDAPRPAARSDLGRLDLPGVVTSTGALSLIVYAVTRSATAGIDVPTALTFALGVVLGVAFLRIERGAVHPVMPLRLFRLRNLTGSATVNLAIGMAHVPVFVLLALYLQHVRGYDPIHSGLAVLPIAAIGLLVGRTLLPRALHRVGPARVLTAGMLLLAAGLALLARLPVDGAYPVDVLPASVLIAFGLPASFAASTIPAVTSVPTTDTGIAAGIVQTAQRVGGALGATGATALAAAWTAHHGGGGAAAYTAGLRASFTVAAAIAVAGALVAALVLRTPPQPPADPAPPLDGPTGDADRAVAV
jgi:EmrB/QacA subfamily drug resistance transporter